LPLQWATRLELVPVTSKQRPGDPCAARWLVIGDPTFRTGTAADWRTLDWREVATPTQLTTRINLAPLRIDPKEFAIGKISPLCGKAAMEYVRSATLLCLDGTIDAMVTAPLNKEAVAQRHSILRAH
jgi:4-hydroxythreonine-4-phosphate dehydrogenase